MKYINIVTAGLLLYAGLASCEMKDELKGGSESSEVGYLDLGVSVNTTQNNNTVVTRSEVTSNGESSAGTVNVNTFPVEIVGTSDATYTLNFESYAALQAENPISLPVGRYTVTAHSNLTLETIMNEPYYEGAADYAIINNDNTTTEVICTMKNTKILLQYSSEFIASFKEWDITIDDGTTNSLAFDETNTSPSAVYWMVSANVTTLNIGVTATNNAGEKVSETRTLTKPASDTSSYWTGGDALTITMNESTPQDPTGIMGSGIDIKFDLTFEEDGETVTIPVTPGTSTGGNTGTGSEDTGGSTEEPGTGASDLAVTVERTSYSLPTDLNENAVVVMTTSAGLTSVKVQITPGNLLFGQMLNGTGSNFGIDFLNGAELINNENLGTIVADMAPGLTAPSTGDTRYEFPVSAFFDVLNEMGATTEANGHVFNIAVTDATGATVSESLSVVVTDSSATE